MSLRFLTGSSGAGKSHTVYTEVIRESAAHPEKQYLVIVPEQFTMQTQKELVRMHPRHGLLNVDVLSFARLAWRVFGEVGGDTLPVLGELGKSLVVQRVTARKQKELKVLGRTLLRQGPVSQMKSVISELLQYGVRPEDLEEWQARQGRSLLAGKLEDIRTVYQGFRDYLEDRYLTTEEIPERMCAVIGESRMVRGSVVVLDGFTGFTPVQYKVIRELLRLAESVTVTVTLDPAEDPLRTGSPHRLFHMSLDTIRRCRALAEELRLDPPVFQTVRAGEKSRFADSGMLRFLEKHLFRYRKQAYAGAPDAAPGGVTVFEAADPRQELQHIAARILRMVRENGYRYRDFAVVTGDLDAYGRDAAALFKAAEIPCFLDQKVTVLTDPVVECIRAALQMTASNYSYDTVFRFLRSGMTGFTDDEIDELDNYVLALGIRGRKRYEEPWTVCRKGMDEKRLAFLNGLRERFVRETQGLHDGMRDRNATVRGKTEALYTFLLQYGLQGKAERLKDELEAEGDPARAKEFAQIYGAVMDLFDRVVEVLGDEKMGMTAFAEVLDAGFAEMTIGLIPPGEDQVLIGDIERTRLKDIKVLFFAGVNEGIIPRAAPTGGILSEMDRETLEKAGTVLAPTAREEMYRQRFYLYLAMTRPSKALCLSYCRLDRSGKSMLPSYLIGTVRRLFPDIPVRTEPEDPMEVLETGEGRTRLLLTGLQELPSKELSAEVKELIVWLRGRPEGQVRLRRCLDAVRAHQTMGGIGRTAAEALYGRELVNSATRLETFAGCAFAHFCRYGLRLQEREVYAFTPADLGTVLHAALERYGLLLQEEGRSWAGLSGEERGRYADRALEEVVTQYGNDILNSTCRNAYLAGRLRGVLYRTVWALQKQIEQGEFRPAALEAAFDGANGMKIRLSGDSSMRLTGRIDRLDLAEKDGVSYVKILDYKTGNVKFDLSRLYYGLQLQLILYLNAAVENEQRKHPDRTVEPAGVFYYHIDDPYIEAEAGDAVETKLLRALRPDGRCRAEEKVLTLFDRELFRGAGSSDVVPVELKKDGTFGRGSQTADRDLFRLIRDFAGSKAAELGDRILSGETAAQPYAYGERTGCDWCPFRSVCGFDERVDGYSYRLCRKWDEEELCEKLKAGSAGRDGA